MSETTEQVRKTLARRYRAEKRFKAFGIGSIGIGLMALLLLFTDIIGKGYSAFFEHEIQLFRLVVVEYAQCDIVLLLVGCKPCQP